MTFRSKVDLWLGVILVGAPAYTLWQCLGSGSYFPIMMVALIYGGLVFPMRYELTDDALVIRSGFLKYRRRYVDITALTPNRSPFSAPALSLDRILVRSSSGIGVNISPNDRERFLNELSKRAPHLVSARNGGLTS